LGILLLEELNLLILTIFNSSIYDREREIAILDFKKEIKSAKDLEIKRI